MKATDKLTREEQMDLQRIFCDGCETDITYTNWNREARLILTTDDKTSLDVFPESMPNPIKRDFHFCGINCLDRWRDKEKT